MDDLTSAYQRLLQARQRRDNLAPTQSLTRRVNQEWIDAVAELRAAERAFMQEAEKFCDHLHQHQPSPYPG